MRILFTALSISAMILLLCIPLKVNGTEAETMSPTDSFGYYIDKYTELTGHSESDDKVGVGEFFGMGSSVDSDDSEKFDGDKYLENFYSSLPEYVKNELPSEDTFSYEQYDFKFFWEKIKSCIFPFLSSLKSGVLSVMGMLLFAAIFKGLTNGEGSMGQALGVLCNSAICVAFFESGLFSLGAAENYLVSLSEVTNAVLPTLAVLLSATGNVSAAAVSTQNLTVFCAVLEYLFSRFLFPLISASAGLSVVGCVLGEKTAFTLSAFFRKISNYIAVFSMTVLVFIMALGTTFAASADSLGMKTVKFAVGSFIPLVGGAVSETLGVVGAGFSYVKNTCGGISLAVIFIILLPCIIRLIISKFTFLLFGAFSGMLDLSENEKLFTELGGITDSLLALAVSTGVVFMLVILFVISCSVRMGGM